MLGTLLTGAAMFFLAAIAPLKLITILPGVELSAAAVSGQAGRVTQAGMQSSYQVSMMNRHLAQRSTRPAGTNQAGIPPSFGDGTSGGPGGGPGPGGGAGGPHRAERGPEAPAPPWPDPPQQLPGPPGPPQSGPPRPGAPSTRRRPHPGRGRPGTRRPHHRRTTPASPAPAVDPADEHRTSPWVPAAPTHDRRHHLRPLASPPPLTAGAVVLASAWALTILGPRALLAAAPRPRRHRTRPVRTGRTNTDPAMGRRRRRPPPPETDLAHPPPPRHRSQYPRSSRDSNSGTSPTGTAPSCAAGSSTTPPAPSPP